MRPAWRHAPVTSSNTSTDAKGPEPPRKAGMSDRAPPATHRLPSNATDAWLRRAVFNVEGCVAHPATPLPTRVNALSDGE